jgi:hypothetical protein
MADTQFTIDVAAKAAGVDTAAAAVDRLAARLTAADTAATQAAEAVAAGEASYRQAEAAADAQAKALERIGVKAADLQAKMAAATAAGDESKFLRLADAADELAQRQVEAAAKADAAKAALNDEAAALDALRANAKSAADQQAHFADAQAKAVAQLDKAKGAADKFRNSQGQMADSAGKALTGIKKLGGPIGGLADTAEDTIEGLTKMSEELGTVGTVAAVGAVAFVAVAVAAAAAAVKIGEVAFWAVKLADKEKRLGKIQEKFKKSTDKLFGGLKINKLLDGFEDLVDLFDETSVTGKAIKVVFESLFQPLIDGVTAFIPKMRTAFIQAEILVLKALIAIKPYGSQILLVAKIMGVILLAAVGLVVAAFAVGFAIMIAFWTIVIKVGQAMQAATEAVLGFGKKVYDYFANTSLLQIGMDLITGLANGILGAGPAVLKALSGVVGGAIDSAKKLLGIASPSKVFAEIGAHTAEGMAVGVEGGTSGVQGSLESLVAPPAPQAQASGGSGSPSLGGATFIFNGVAGAEDAVAKFEELLTRFAEGDVAQLGGAVPA